MAFSCFLHRKFHRPSISDLFGARSFALIPTCLALLTSVFILVYISSTSKLIRHQHDHSHLFLLRPSVRSSRISYQIVQTSFHNPQRNASDGVPPESIIEGNEVQSVSNYSREGAEIHQPVVVLRSDGSNEDQGPPVGNYSSDEVEIRLPSETHQLIDTNGTLVYGDNPVWSHAGELVYENRQPDETHQSNGSNDEPPVWNSSHGVGIGQPLQSRPSADSEGNHLKEVFHDKENFFEDYKEMNRSFKIYVYPHSKDDPFANTLLPVNSEPGGNYASEAYFKKALTKSHFITKDPSEADLFYMPFSIAALRHDRRVGVGGIPTFVQAYIHNISHTYPYWNRSGGADHFYVACHSIGNTATKKADEVRLNAIQLVCSSSYFVTAYIAHKDASVPQIWPRHDDPPTFSLSKRKRLAFFAGAVNSRIRQEVLNTWKNDSEIFVNSGRLKTPYSDALLGSKFCLHLKGFEVNTARIGDAMFYGCVPVIIADYYDLPFVDILNWKSFSLIVPSLDITLLKRILNGVSSVHYSTLQRNVLKVRKHFKWHPLPVDYDAFYMVIYELWLRRTSLKIPLHV